MTATTDLVHDEQCTDGRVEHYTTTAPGGQQALVTRCIDCQAQHNAWTTPPPPVLDFDPAAAVAERQAETMRDRAHSEYQQREVAASARRTARRA